MSIIYLPSCKSTIHSPEASTKIKRYLLENYDAQIAGCCMVSQKIFKHPS